MAKNDLVKWASSYEFASDDEKIGAQILIDSLESPIYKILSNAGLDASRIIGKLNDEFESSSDKSHEAYGYDVVAKKYTNMVEAGIIDPTEVIVNEIQNASSISGLLLTTDCLIVEEDEPKANVPAGMPGMM